MQQIKLLNEIAKQRNQSLAQMAIAWLLKDNKINSVLIGASFVEQLNDNINSLTNTAFSAEELSIIDQVLES